MFGVRILLAGSNGGTVVNLTREDEHNGSIDHAIFRALRALGAITMMNGKQ